MVFLCSNDPDTQITVISGGNLL